MEQEQELESVLERYDHLISVFLSTQKELIGVLRQLRRFGVYKSPPKGTRFPLPDERKGITYKMELGAPPKGFEGYATSGLYPDGNVGEIFLEAEKKGTFVSGILDAFAVVFSLGMQYGVPLEHVVEKLKNQRFEPAGFTKNKDIPSAVSVIDYLMKWLELNYCNWEKKDG